MIVRPIITYLWDSKVSKRKRIDKAQRLACVCITESMRTCPTRALEIITYLTPLHLVIDRVAHEAILKISKEGTEGRGNERIKNQIVWSSLNSYNISSANLPSDVMIKKVSTEKNLRTLLSKREDWEREYTDYSLKENTFKWYTDGFKTSRGAGDIRAKYHLSYCLDINLERNYQKCDIAIQSDIVRSI